MSSWDTHDVTVIVPVYVRNEEQVGWLYECLDSVVSQRCSVVVWDDGSPYDLSDVAEDYIPHIDWYEYPVNRGVASARNSAAERVTTPLFLPLDCDDILVENAVRRMVSEWKGKPIYPDISMFGDRQVDHFRLLDFSCEAIRDNVGAYSVNVLHTKEQWKSVGGWDERLDFYEDGEYTARLMMRYCGQRLPEPLVRYRIHGHQRTKLYEPQREYFTRRVMGLIGRIDDMCCGSKRRSSANNPVQSASLFTSVAQGGVQVPRSELTKVMYKSTELTVPLEVEGRILAKYIGGEGKGKHTYKGLATGTPYKRIMFGALVYAHPNDVYDEVKREGNSSSLLRKVVVQKVAASAPKVKKVEQPVEPVEEVAGKEEREPVASDVERTPVEDVDEEEFEEEEDVIDIAELTVKDAKAMKFTPEEAEVLLEDEKQGKNRVSMVSLLSSILEG